MVIALVCLTLVTIFCLVLGIMAIRDGQVAAAVCFVGFTIIYGVSVGLTIDAMSKNNEHMVEYRFSSAHYNLQEEVSSSIRTVRIDSVEVIEETRDTTYILTGKEPIMLKSNNYERKVLKGDE